MPITGLIDKGLLAACKDQLQRAVASVEHADVAHVAHVPKDGLSLSRFSRDAVADIQAFNAPVANKSPELLREKYTRMSKDPFAFFRGTDHLFYQDLKRLDGNRMVAGPTVMLQGDLHLGNFGTIQRVHRGLDVGANDFDEAHVGPVTLDLQRFATSVVLQARQMGLSGGKTNDLIKDFADTYTRTLNKVTTGEINLTPKAPDSVRHLLVKSSSRDALAAVDKKAPLSAGTRALKRDAFNTTVSAVTRRDVDAAYQRFVASLPPQQAAAWQGYRVSDVVSSVAGVGSVGRSRYRVLLEGPKGHPPPPDRT